VIFDLVSFEKAGTLSTSSIITHDLVKKKKQGFDTHPAQSYIEVTETNLAACGLETGSSDG